MDTAQVAAIAKQIVEGELLYNWKYHAVLLALILVAVCVANYIGSYLKTRGQSLATKADFDQLLDQLRKTTETTENIKRTVSHEDWKLKEFKTLRRNKLEELMIAIYDAHHWVDRKMKASLFDGEENQGTEPIGRVEILAGLYFQELTVEVFGFNQAYLNYKKFLVDSKSKLLQLKTNPDAYGLAMKEVVSAHRDFYKPMLAATSALELKARAVMKDILDVGL